MSEFAKWSNKQPTFGSDNAERFYGRREGWIAALKWAKQRDNEGDAFAIDCELEELENE